MLSGKYIKRKNNSRQMRSDVQVLRGIAVFGVVLNHADLDLTGGFIGVDVFFVISGFFITEIIKNQYKLKKRIDLKDFYIRRLLRLIPSLIFVSSLVCILMIFFNNPSGAQQNSAKTALATNFFIGNYIIEQGQNNYFASNAFYNPLMHFWTLSVEWQFYILFPLIVYFYVNFIHTKYNKSMVRLIGLFFSLLYIYIFLSDNFNTGDYFMITFRLWEFAVGIFCSLIPKYVFSKNNIFLSLRISSYVALLSCMFYIDKYSKLPGPVLFIPVFATFFLIYSGTNQIRYKSIFSKVLLHIGDISYPVYLWHWPIFISIQYLFPNMPYKVLVYLTVTYILSLFTHAYIEKPFRNYDGNLKMSTKFIVKISTISSVLSLLVGLLSSVTMHNYVAQGKLKTSISGEIYNFSNDRELVFKECTLNGQPIMYTGNCLSSAKLLGEIKTNKNILVMGDSHAKHLLPGLERSYPGDNIVFIGTNNFHKVSIGNNYRFKDLMSQIRNQDLIIISSYWDQFGINSDLASYLDLLSKNNGKIFVNLGTPKFSFSSFRCKFGVSLFISNRVCENSASYSMGSESVDNLYSLTNKISGVAPLNSYDAFCNKTKCSMLKNKSILFYDNNHLNYLGSIYLIEYFKNNYQSFTLN